MNLSGYHQVFAWNLRVGSRGNSTIDAFNIPAKSILCHEKGGEIYRRPFTVPTESRPLQSWDGLNGETREESVFSGHICAVSESRHNQRRAEKSSPDQFSI
ncbi:hypothetical protein FHT70_003088 [Rhizobium sp. BK049]|uniref:hypothetical protein n=1 Tax=unclassified Rhizobium TaxID=2613769 RepID=UPI00160EF428|nr:hypothetical protein [Rhizobium sp. BK049]